MRTRSCMRVQLIGFTLGCASAVVLAAAPSSTWDFENNAVGWRVPDAAGGIVAEPDNAANHAFQIVATKPHHTQMRLAGSEATPNFVAALRVKLLAHEGATPAAYVYGRLGAHGFRGVCVRPGSVQAMAYLGQGMPSVSFGNAQLPARDGWVRITLACYGPDLLAKAWLDGTPEPGWQMEGKADGQPAGAFAIGVWTSPRTRSTAKVLFDDITFRPVGKAEFAALQASAAARPPLVVDKIAAKDGLFETATAIGLATPTTLVAFDRRSGALAHLVHRASGREFVARRSEEPLFELSLTKPRAGEAMEVAANEFRRLVVTKTGVGRLQLEYREHLTLPLTARVTATAGADGLLRLRISIGNPSPWAVARIAFPKFSAPAALGGDAGDDRLLLPLSHTDGAVIEAPGAMSLSRSARYPQSACTQCAALYDSTAGLYLAAHDPDGHCKLLGVRSLKGRSVEIPFEHLLPESEGRDAALSYDVALGTFTGDWRDAADIYKRWARQQSWCATRLAQRDDIPAFLKDGAGILIAGIQNANGYNGLLGKDLERLAQLCAAYRQRTGLKHIVFVPYGWEGRGTWAGIHYLPAVPSDEAWRRANAALRAQGDRVAMLTSGFWWVVKRKASSNGPAFDDTAEFERLKEMVIWQADGKPFTADAYDKVGTFGDWRGLSLSLCHGSAAARETMLKIFLDVARLGTPLVSFDQEIGGGQNAPCYCATHGHAPGYGPWMWTEFRDLCAEILRQGKPIQPELGLFMENCGEPAIPWMATYWSRQFGEVDHGCAGARGVGLFSYLYHEYVTAIGAACVQGQGQSGTRPSAELRCVALANNLTRGLIPGPFLQDVPLESPEGSWASQVARAYFAFCKPYACFPEYLLLGETRRPPTLRCAEQEVWFWRGDARGQPLRPGGPKVRKTILKLPAVTAGSFAAADGSLGTIIVNTTTRPQQVALRPEAGKLAVLYSADRTKERHWAAAPAEISITLEPFGTRMLITRAR
jgi:hypothetical protein